MHLASLQLNIIAYHMLNWHNQSRKSFGKMQPIAVIMWTNWDITHWSLNKRFGLWQTMFCVALSRTTSCCLLLKWLEFVPDREYISLIVIYALVRCRIFLSQKWPCICIPLMLALSHNKFVHLRALCVNTQWESMSNVHYTVEVISVAFIFKCKY